MRVFMVFFIVSFGFTLSVFSEEISPDSSELKAATDANHCIELEDIISDLQGELFKIETRMKMEVYPSCARHNISPSLDDYCSIESNLSFILQNYIDKCE